MKKLVLLLATVAATTAAGFAQAPAARPMPAQAGTLPSPAELAKRGTQYLTKELSLSAGQQTKIQPVLLAQNQELLAMRAKVQAGRSQTSAAVMSEKMKATLAKYDGQIKGILTPGQYAKYTKMRDEERNKAMKHLAKQGVAMPATR